MQIFGKVLVVMTLIASLSFFGLTMAAYLGGPNWGAEMRDLQGEGEFSGFRFTRNDSGAWTAGRTKDEKPVATSPIQPEVIVGALKAVTGEQQKELQRLQEGEARLKAQTEAWEVNRVADEKALETRQNELLKQFEDTRRKASELANQVASKTEDARKIEQRITERREDVIRLRTQLDEMRTDSFRLQELRQELTDRLQQVLDDLDRARDRNQSLQAVSAGSQDSK